MKKYLVLLAALFLLGTLAGCSAEAADCSGEIAAMRQEIAQLRSQVAALQEQVAALEAGAVADWSLTGTPLTQGSGAEITLTVTPTAYREGQMALLRVVLEGMAVAELYCHWDGTAYSGRVQLDAADGYSYHLILSDPEGDVEHLELNSPENPRDSRLVYLYSSLHAACMLNVFEWRMGDGQLLLDAGTAEVQLPTLTANGGTAQCSSARLMLLLDGEVLESRELTIPEPEEGSLVMGVNGIAFELPEPEEGSQLELVLEIALSDGQILTCSGSSWYLLEGEWVQAVG